MPNSTELYEESPETFLPLFNRWADDAGEQVDQMLERLADEYEYSPDSVLDVGCGIGRHTIQFAERGLDAHGLDLSAEYIERARERAAAAGVKEQSSFVQHDMRNLDELSETYDLVVTVWTSFGFFDDETNAAVIEAFRDRLNPGGALLLEVPNKDGFLTDWSGASVGRPAEDSVHAESHEYDPLTSRVTVTIFAIENETYVGEGQFETRVYSPNELEQAVEEAGFNDVQMVGGLDGEELKRGSRRLLVMGRK